MHLLGQSAHIMMALDHLSCNVETLNAVGIYRTLSQPLGIRYLLGLRIEHLNEITAYYLALLLRVGHSFKVFEELLARVYPNHVKAKTFVIFHHLSKLVLAQHSMIDEYTSEVLAYRLVQQHGANGRIHTAAETENDTVVAELGFEFLHGCLHKRRRAPLLLAAADAYNEILKQLLALQRVENLRMELDGPKRGFIAGVSSILNIGGRSDHMAVIGNGGNGIAMAHPHLRIILKSLEQRIAGIKHSEVGTAILTAVGLLDLSAVAVRYELRSVANTKYRQATYKPAEINLERLRVVYRVWRAAEDHSNHRRVVFRILVVRKNLTESIKLTDTTANELRGLRTEIKNDYLLLHIIIGFGYYYCFIFICQLFPSALHCDKKASASERISVFPTSISRRPSFTIPLILILSHIFR